MVPFARMKTFKSIGFSSHAPRLFHFGATGITFVHKQNLNPQALFSTSQVVVANKPSASKPPANSTLDPDKIKGPGGLTMTQIGKMVQGSRARDLEHQKKQQQQSSSPKRK
ncbi:hypothetical protein BGZ93_006501 [Podila epicladia]|nr:hypothetical protein BGZ92_010135 [Podila epicladia]KAG0094969.1 hypothetical protein BGZ93_006501 [Podila epicladia]